MGLVIDENIEKDLKFLLVTVATLCKKVPSSSNNLKKVLTNDYYINLVMPFIVNDYKINYKKMRNLIHIILYNYNYADIISDYVYEEKNFLEMVETLPVDALLTKVTNDKELSFYLIQRYFHIIFDRNLKEILDNNEAIYEELPWIESWPKQFNNFELITSKLKNIYYFK